jgi:2',3'-cyclic-nucleotide 2'-phosphodiesterase (5'-nucleotidase family)
VASRPDVQAVVDAANAEVAPILNEVIGDPAEPNQIADIERAPTRLFESAMGNLVADAMREAYLTDPVTGDPEADAAYTNSGGLRADLACDDIAGTEDVCQITRGELFAVLPFGNSTVIETLTGAQMKTAFINGFTPFCDAAFAGGTGRFPQISGLKVEFHCNGATPVIDSLSKAPDGPAGTLTPVADSDTVRFVTNDFMFTGGDGYTVFTQGTNVKLTGDLMLDVVADYIAAHQPVDPVVDGRIVGP